MYFPKPQEDIHISNDVVLLGWKQMDSGVHVAPGCAGKAQ